MDAWMVRFCFLLFCLFFLKDHPFRAICFPFHWHTQDTGISWNVAFLFWFFENMQRLLGGTMKQTSAGILSSLLLFFYDSSPWYTDLITWTFNYQRLFNVATDSSFVIHDMIYNVIMRQQQDELHRPNMYN